MRGELAARAALDRMLEGTSLMAREDSQNGAFVVFRKASEPNGPRAFDLPGDRATRTFPLFSEQSGRGPIADVDLVRDVTTKAIKGGFTPRDAVERMLGGAQSAETAVSAVDLKYRFDEGQRIYVRTLSEQFVSIIRHSSAPRRAGLATGQNENPVARLDYSNRIDYATNARPDDRFDSRLVESEQKKAQPARKVGVRGL